MPLRTDQNVTAIAEPQGPKIKTNCTTVRSLTATFRESLHVSRHAMFCTWKYSKKFGPWIWKRPSVALFIWSATHQHPKNSKCHRTIVLVLQSAAAENSGGVGRLDCQGGTNSSQKLCATDHIHQSSPVYYIVCNKVLANFLPLQRIQETTTGASRMITCYSCINTTKSVSNEKDCSSTHFWAGSSYCCRGSTR